MKTKKKQKRTPYFSSIAKKLTTQLPPPNQQKSSFKNSKTKNSFFFNPMTISEVKRIVLSLKPKNSSGQDIFPAKLLRVLPEQVLETLAYIFKQSLVTGKFIEAFKKAKMIPIYKKGNPLHLQNYRRISLLIAFSKILEKAVHTRMLSYLNRCKTLSKFQFGFRPTILRLLLVNKITKHFRNIRIALTVFLDLTKAFDVLDHKIRLNKLYQYGFRGLSHAWLASYLAKRSQQVYIHG